MASTDSFPSPPSPDEVSATSDIFGHAIGIGSRVRTFHFPDLSGEGQLVGFDLDGARASYIEGVVEAIGEDVIEGCPRYRVRVERDVVGGVSRPPKPEEVVFPPVNGTATVCGRSTVGVVAI